MPIQIHPAGEIIKKENLIFFPLGQYRYAYNHEGFKGVSEAIPIEEIDENTKKKKIIGWDIDFGGKRYLFQKKPIKNPITSLNLTNEDIEIWRNRKTHIEVDELYRKVKEGIKTCFDFVREIDYDVAVMFVLQSWFSDLLEAVFYLDIKSKYGAGKTVLLEIFEILCKNGLLINEISFAAIPRCVENYKLTCLIDELDNIQKKERYEIFKILRAGYRKGSQYIRLKPKTLEVESFKVFGPKAFNYRSDIPDDLKSRSLAVNLAKSEDKFLPILNFYKKKILKDTYRELWIFYMNYLEWLTKLTNNRELIVNKNYRIGKGGKIPPSRSKKSADFFINFVNQPEISQINRAQFKQMLENYHLYEPSKSLLEWLTNISGRNIELFFLIVQLCEMLKLEHADWFLEIFEEKEVTELLDITEYQELLKDVAIDLFVLADEKDGMKILKHRKLAQEFNARVKESLGIKPTSHELKKQMRELGFIDNLNRKVIKIDGKAHLCIIYDKRIQKILGLEQKTNTPPISNGKQEENEK